MPGLQEVVESSSRQQSNKVLPQCVRSEIESRWEGKPLRLYAYADRGVERNSSPTWVVLGDNEIAFARLEEPKRVVVSAGPRRPADVNVMLGISQLGVPFAFASLDRAGRKGLVVSGQGLLCGNVFDEFRFNEKAEFATVADNGKVYVDSFPRARVAGVSVSRGLLGRTLTLFDQNGSSLGRARFSATQQQAFEALRCVLELQTAGHATVIRGDSDELYLARLGRRAGFGVVEKSFLGSILRLFNAE